MADIDPAEIDRIAVGLERTPARVRVLLLIQDGAAANLDTRDFRRAGELERMGLVNRWPDGRNMPTRPVLTKSLGRAVAAVLEAKAGAK